LVVVKPERVAVGALEFGVDVDESLDVILAGGISRMLFRGKPKTPSSTTAASSGFRE
jgi:hypothetical protein